MEENQQKKGSPFEIELSKATNSNLYLSKEHKSFQQLIEKIRKLEASISIEFEIYEFLLKRYNEEIIIHFKELSQMKIDMVFYIDSKVLIMNLTKRQMRQLKAYITMHMQDAFKHCEPTKEMIKLYDKYSIDLTYQEEVDNANEVDKESFLEILKAQFDYSPIENHHINQRIPINGSIVKENYFRIVKEAKEILNN